MEDTIPKGRGALDAFINLLNLITLGWVAIWFGRVVFWIINKNFSPQFIAYSNQSDLKFGLASLIIVTPIFLALAGYLHRLFKDGRLSPESGIHKWLTYLMLLVSSLAVIGDLVALVFKLLNGDYTLSFFLKVIAIFVIASMIFGYYWFDLKRKNYSRRNKVSVLAMSIVIVVALAAIVGSLFIIDSPAVARMKGYDQQRVNDLGQIDSMIINDYQNNGKLPDSLSADKYKNINDPETQKSYQYSIKGPKSYELCANFSLDVSKDNKGYNNGYMTAPIDFRGEDWFYHKAGYQCFTKNISDNLIKPPLQ